MNTIEIACQDLLVELLDAGPRPALALYGAGTIKLGAVGGGRWTCSRRTTRKASDTSSIA
jgi:hypothetical protein